MLETTAPIAVFRTGQGIVPHPKVGRARAGVGGGGGVCGAVRGGVGRWAGWAGWPQQDGGYQEGEGGYHGGGGGSPGLESIYVVRTNR